MVLRTWRRVASRRSAPFAGALLAAFMVAPIGTQVDGLTYVAAAVLGAISVGVLDRRQGTLAPSFLFLAAAALLRHCVGGATAGITVITLLPVIVTALHGTRAQLAPVIAGVAAYFVLPVALVGGERYPASGLRSGALYVVVGAMIGYTVQRLVAQVRDRMFEATKRGTALEDLAFTDALTGLGNRRAWETWLDAALGAAGDGGAPLCVAVFDLDHFKAYNDGHGHPAGDGLLAAAATAWRGELRPTDVLARYGGEEFAAVLPTCSLADAHVVVERIRAATPRGQTVSAGIAQWDGEEDAPSLVARADAALYAAKAAGRDRALAAA
ncbi:MAG TPA: GGDEF domain-containing protein [Solirubrobacteraceae bacterium]|nr:GGDEF domain-containing protein [Solirubrobacteraceae bacterium]